MENKTTKLLLFMDYKRKNVFSYPTKFTLSSNYIVSSIYKLYLNLAFCYAISLQTNCIQYACFDSHIKCLGSVNGSSVWGDKF